MQSGVLASRNIIPGPCPHCALLTGQDIGTRARRVGKVQPAAISRHTRRGFQTAFLAQPLHCSSQKDGVEKTVQCHCSAVPHRVGSPQEAGPIPREGTQTAWRWFYAFFKFSRPHTVLGTFISILSVSLLALVRTKPEHNIHSELPQSFGLLSRAKHAVSCCRAHRHWVEILEGPSAGPDTSTFDEHPHCGCEPDI